MAQLLAQHGYPKTLSPVRHSIRWLSECESMADVDRRPI